MVIYQWKKRKEFQKEYDRFRQTKIELGYTIIEKMEKGIYIMKMLALNLMRNI